MSDSTERYMKLIKSNADKVTISILGLMLLGMGGALLLEKNNDLASSQPEPEILKLEDPLTANPNWKLVQAMSTKQDMAQYPAIRQIRQYNMFDYKSVKDREALERAANQKYDQAERLKKEGKNEEAKRLAQEVLGSIPTHRRAKELLDQLTAPPGGKTPAPGAAPVTSPVSTPATSPAR